MQHLYSLFSNGKLDKKIIVKAKKDFKIDSEKFNPTDIKKEVMIKEIKLPEIADNVTTAIVLEIQVSAGDKVEKDDTLAEMESDKATFELPSDFGGTVKEIKVSTGDEVKVGQVMFTIDTSADGEEKSEDKEDGKKAEKADEKPEPKEVDEKES
jgi:pyruvate dehydrogenase E2 component (dihydrolipoamide acetyltransferase)